jgi:hypothetical protein
MGGHLVFLWGLLVWFTLGLFSESRSGTILSAAWLCSTAIELVCQYRLGS